MINHLLLEKLASYPIASYPIASEVLARMLGMTEDAVRENIDALRIAGLDIEVCHGTHGEMYSLKYPLELLDADKILAALSNSVRAQISALTLEFDTDSTQARAWSVASPEQGCAVWLAERQTAGQGRQGRAWISPLAANLYISVSRRFDGGIAAMSGLSLVVGVVIAETLRHLGFSNVGIKWPNDIWAEERKLGGILVQLRGLANGSCEAIIGIGINVRMPHMQMPSIDQPWIDLSSLASKLTMHQTPSRNVLASALLERLLPALDVFERQGLAAFLSRWHELDVLAGRLIYVQDDRRRYEGRMLGITNNGALRLSHAEGERHCHAGEVSVRPL